MDSVGDKVLHKGSCHCGTVTFEVMAPKITDVTVCNCSICNMSGFLHLFVKAEDLRLISGEDNLSEYRFNTKVARHLFCKTCGVKPFYRPRSHPEGWSINLNCLDRDGFDEISFNDFDGANWEANIAALKARDKD